MTDQLDPDNVRDEMREMGEQTDPVREMLRRMVAEFCDYHYGTCAADLSLTAKCDCFAGALLVDAISTLRQGEPR